MGDRFARRREEVGELEGSALVWELHPVCSTASRGASSSFLLRVPFLPPSLYAFLPLTQQTY